MVTCRHHRERTAERVCSVCGTYYCDDCVGERYYPSPGYICHECSGEKPVAAATEESEQAEETPEAPRERSVLVSSLKDRLIVSSEWLVLLACIAIIAYPLLNNMTNTTEQLSLKSDTPDDLAEYCLGLLDQMEYRGDSPTVSDIKHACHYPIDVAEEDGYIIVMSPDPEIYGFSEILVESNPMVLTILE